MKLSSVEQKGTSDNKKNMNDVLAKLFGSANRVKIIRLFLLNPGGLVSSKDVSRRAKVASKYLRKELLLLYSIGLISKRKEGWALNGSFSFLLPLKQLLLNTAPFSGEELIKKIGRTGKIKTIILAGIFIHAENSRVDILVVGDDIKKGQLERVLKEIEAEIGKELSYAALSTQDFVYRLGIYDKFVRDVLDYPHEKILNRLGI